VCVIIDERVNLNGVAGIGLSDLHLFSTASYLLSLLFLFFLLFFSGLPGANRQ
jgi:hypothetical protein